MDRREFLKGAATIPLLSTGDTQAGCSGQPTPAVEGPAQTISRVRPGDLSWPSQASWEKLRQDVGGRLIEVKSPLAECRAAPQSAACRELFKELKNPYYIGDQPALTQTSGWLDAWTSAPSVYAVAAAETADIVAAVNFARAHRLRLVVKGGGHSYQGTSNAADSLLIWTRAMHEIVSHDAFVPQDCAGKVAPQPAVTVGAGAIWMHVYDAVTTRGGRYVQGGGCGTVGVAGLIQSGGFSSFSKKYGLAAAGLLEAEVVTADGAVQVANACTNPELFWALKGGGGGSFGVVAKLTLRTRELPEYFGGVSGTIKARSDAAFRKLIARIVGFYSDRLFNPHWGEQIQFLPGNTVQLHMVCQGLDGKEAKDVWRPFLDWVAGAPQDFILKEPVNIGVLPARHLWDAKFLQQYLPQLIVRDDRPNAPAGNVLWAGNREEAGQFLHGYRSAWLPTTLLEKDRQAALADALFASSRHWEVSLHFNKGLGGAPADERAAAKDTAMNPVVLDAFALAIIAGNSRPAFPDIPGHEPDVATARRHAAAINKAMDELLKLVNQPGSYVSESDFFERAWQQSFWGSNYPRLAAVKKKYDPSGLFFVHHGVGSDEWSADGFKRLTGR
ncbi:MAG TPA: FAD-binding oxidoreductase [Gemmataceae bacterium]|nr:FAD-binding oxidoreductase [Gemmataceae bacterium]